MIGATEDETEINSVVSKLSNKEKAEKLDLGLALGNGEVALSELVPAFSVFTRDGTFIPLRYTKAASPKEIEYSKVYNFLSALYKILSS